MSVKAGGLRPAARSGVSLTVAANGKGYIFGGVQDTDEDEEHLDGQFTNEMHALDLASQTWRLIELLGRKEKKSTKSKADEASDDDMDTSAASAQGKKARLLKPLLLNFRYHFIYRRFLCSAVSTDGIFTMTVGGSSGPSQSGKSKSKSTAADIPSARMKPGLAISKGTLYLYGGEYESGSKQYTLNDFYALG